jgi:hypothetical protein
VQKKVEYPFLLILYISSLMHRSLLKRSYKGQFKVNRNSYILFKVVA